MKCANLFVFFKKKKKKKKKGFLFIYFQYQIPKSLSITKVETFSPQCCSPEGSQCQKKKRDKKNNYLKLGVGGRSGKKAGGWGWGRKVIIENEQKRKRERKIDIFSIICTCSLQQQKNKCWSVKWTKSLLVAPGFYQGLQRPVVSFCKKSI